MKMIYEFLDWIDQISGHTIIIIWTLLSVAIFTPELTTVNFLIFLLFQKAVIKLGKYFIKWQTSGKINDKDKYYVSF